MRVPKIVAKPFVTAGLVGAMVAPSLLSPAAALAIGTAEGAAPGSGEAGVPDASVATPETRFSEATQRLIAAADGEIQITLEEAKQLLASVQAAADAAKGADDQQQRVVTQAKTQVTQAETAVSNADAEAAAELQSQVAALNKKLSDAVAEAQALQQQKADAEQELKELEAQRADAAKTLEELQAKLDEANKKLEDAQAALDALGDDPTADEQAAYDEAKAAYDAAVADQKQKQQAADEAKSTLDGLQGQLEQKQSERAALEAQLPGLQKDAEDANAALADAQANYDEALEAAGDESAADKIAQLEQAAAEAQQKLDEANASIQELPGQIQDIEDQIAAEQAKVSDAQTAADKASDAASKAEQAVDEAKAALDAASSDTDYLEWRAEQDKLDAEVADARAELDKVAGDPNDAYRVDAYGQVVHLGSIAYWLKTIDRMDAEIEEQREAISKLEAQYGEAKDVVVDDLYDFMTWLSKMTHSEVEGGTNSDAAAALNYLAFAADFDGDGKYDAAAGVLPPYTGDVNTDQSAWITKYTHIGESGDGTTLDNVMKALDVVDELNKIRQDVEGLPALKVSLAGMVEAIYFANWSAETDTADHATNQGYKKHWGSGGTWAENAAFGVTPQGACNGWYWQEKANYLLQKDGTESITSTDGTVYRGIAGGDTGHYLNIIRNDLGYVGAGVAQGGRYGQVIVADFAQNDSLNSNYYQQRSFTTEELRDLIDQAVDAGITSHDYPSSLEREIESQKLDLRHDFYSQRYEDGEITETLNPYRGWQIYFDQFLQENPDAKEAFEAWQGVYSEAFEHNASYEGGYPVVGDELTELQQAYDEAKAAYDQALADKKVADDKLAAVKADAESAIAGLNKQKDEFTDQLTTAQNGLEGLKQAAQKAADELEDAREQYADLTLATEELAKAQSAADAANAALEKAQQDVSALDEPIAGLKQQVADAQSDYKSKKAAADAAGPTAEQDKAVKDAAAALEKAQAEYDRLLGARDDARAAVDDAKAAKDAADARLAQIEASISEKEALVADAEAKLPGAQAKANAWAAVFNQQTPESIVTDGFTGTTEDADIAAVLADAHLSYQEKIDLLAAAQAKLKEAQEAYDIAAADKATTEQELAEKLADLAAAQEAYDRLASKLAPTQQAVAKTEGAAKTEKSPTKTETPAGKLTQTGDPATAMAAGMALAGAAAVVGGAHFRRRRSE